MAFTQLELLGENIDSIFFVFAAAIFLIEVIELGFKGNFSRAKITEMLASASTQVPYLLIEAFLITGLYSLFHVLAYSSIPWMMDISWTTALLAILAADFAYYWEHRIAHRVRILWTQHAVHHSSRDYNIITAIRFGPLESVWSLLAHMPLLLIGFPPELIFFGIIVVLAYQTWLHTELVGKLGRLEWVLNTPSHHRVHHECDQKYLDKNYAGILIIWDRMFGSFQEEEETPTYGLTTNFNSKNPIKVWFSEFPALWRNLKSSKTIAEIFGYLFNPLVGKQNSPPIFIGGLNCCHLYR
ncbi:MAG: sterol desaturase family protein [Rhodobacteraceae bacterium]|nr:sterol desaturase family protein [Paracoccaceae bacterium]